jgi:L-ascorbate metabolism protein UlaG (beta-lactamase superfamily)
LKSKEEGIVLIGHASFLIRTGGKLIITDPQLTSPSMWNWRYSTLPFKIEELTGIDYILLSHDHFDHMDEESLKQLYKQNPNVVILTGLRTTPLMQEWMPGVRVMEAGWYQEYQTGKDSISFTFLPTRHWSRRGLFDQNLRLWGSFLIKSSDIKIYFGGDSGYGSHFEEIFNLFGEVDYAIIGIGAYKPRWFMHANHTSPLEALRAARLMKTKNLIPMHYGTFAMGDEPLGDPHRTVTREYAKRNYKFRLILPNPGEKIVFK